MYQDQDTILIDVKASQIKWKGTKMRGLGKHEGTIGLKDGYLVLSDDKLVGGMFMVDMHSMEVTDIPAHEPIPRRNLINHLKSEDFFAVDQFPEAVLRLTSIEEMDSTVKINGILSMRGISNPVEFEAAKVDRGYQAKILLDRFTWNIAYEGSWVDRTLVDREIELEVYLKKLAKDIN